MKLINALVMYNHCPKYDKFDFCLNKSEVFPFMPVKKYIFIKKYLK